MKYEKWIRDWKTALAENFFLKVMLLLLAIGFILNANFLKKKERIILVPPKLEKEVWVEKDKISPEYMEQMAIFFATLAGNISPSNAEYSAKILKEYISPERYPDFESEIVSQALYIKKNNIQQSFYPSEVKVEEDSNKVTVNGTVVRFIGQTKVSNEKMAYIIRFSHNNYKVMIDEFYADYLERKKKDESISVEDIKNKIISDKTDTNKRR